MKLIRNTIQVRSYLVRAKFCEKILIFEILEEGNRSWANKEGNNESR